MANLETIVNSQITRETAVVERAGFGVTLILSPHVRWTERVRTYTTLAALLDDFDSDDPVAIAVTRLFGQELKPTSVKVGRRQVDSVIVTVDDVVNATEYTVAINGTEFAFTSDVDATDLEIAAGLVAAINAGSEPVTATDNADGTYTLTTDTPGTAFSAIPDARQVMGAIIDVVRVEVASVVDETDYTVTINGVDFTVDSGVGASAASIAALLETAINAGAEPVTAVDEGAGVLRLEHTDVGKHLSIEVDGTLMALVDADESITDAVTACRAADTSWYGFMMTSRYVADVKEAMTVLETLQALGVFASNDSDIPGSTLALDGGTIAAFNVGNALDRSVVWYHTAPELYPEAALLGLQLAKDPGSSTWEYKTFSLVEYDTITDTQQTNLTEKLAMSYQRIAGNNITFGVRVGANEYPDVIVGADYLRSRIAEDLFALLLANEKVPYTNAGITLVTSTVQARLEDGVALTILSSDPAPEVTAPDAADVDPADKAARLLPDVEWSGTLAGAIHQIRVHGRVSV